MRNKINYINYILVIFMVVFSFMDNVYATDAYENLHLDFVAENTEVVVGEEVVVGITLKTDLPIKECLIKIEEDQNVIFDSFGGEVNVWKPTEKGNNGIIVKNNGNNVDFNSGLKILNLKYKVNGSGSLKIATSSYCSDDEEGEYLVSGTKELKLTAKSLDEITTLKSIKVNGKDLDKFSSNKTEGYMVHLENGTFSLSYETTNPDFQDDVVVTMENGTKIDDLNNIKFYDPTNQNMMEIKLVVNNATTYSFVVRYEQKELDNSLKSLKIDGKSIDLRPGQLDGYSIKVSKDVTSVRVEAVLMDNENFKIELQESGVWDQSIQGTSTNIPISIVPVNDGNGGTAVTYMVEVIREGGGSSSAPSSSSSNVKPSSSKLEDGPQGGNPGTGDISMFVMALILISSLVGSVLLYQKNVENYK